MSISGGQYCIMDPNECCTICGLTHWFATSGNDMRENVVGGEASSRLYFLHVLMCAQFLKTAQRAWNTCYLFGFQKTAFPQSLQKKEEQKQISSNSCHFPKLCRCSPRPRWTPHFSGIQSKLKGSKTQKVDVVEPLHVDSTSPCWSQGKRPMTKTKAVTLMWRVEVDAASKVILHKDFAWLQYFPPLSKVRCLQSLVFSTWSYWEKKRIHRDTGI